MQQAVHILLETCQMFSGKHCVRCFLGNTEHRSSCKYLTCFLANILQIFHIFLADVLHVNILQIYLAKSPKLKKFTFLVMKTHRMPYF